MLGRRFERERIARDTVLPEPKLQVASAEQRRHLPIAVPDVAHDCLRRGLLRVRNQEVQETAFTAAGRAEYQRVTDVLHVKVEGVRRAMRRLEDGQGFLSKVRTHGVAVIERKQETQVREVGF